MEKIDEKTDSKESGEKTNTKDVVEKSGRKRKTARPARSGSPRRTRSSDFYTSMVEEAIRLSKHEDEIKKKKDLKKDLKKNDLKNGKFYGLQTKY